MLFEIKTFFFTAWRISKYLKGFTRSIPKRYRDEEDWNSIFTFLASGFSDEGSWWSILRFFARIVNKVNRRTVSSSGHRLGSNTLSLDYFSPSNNKCTFIVKYCWKTPIYWTSDPKSKCWVQEEGRRLVPNQLFGVAPATP